MITRLYSQTVYLTDSVALRLLSLISYSISIILKYSSHHHMIPLCWSKAFVQCFYAHWNTFLSVPYHIISLTHHPSFNSDFTFPSHLQETFEKKCLFFLIFYSLYKLCRLSFSLIQENSFWFSRISPGQVPLLYMFFTISCVALLLFDCFTF